MFSESAQILQRGAAAILVLALLCLLLWALRRRGMAHFSFSSPLHRAPRRLSVVERLPLTSQHSLFLVQITDKLVVLGSSPSGINLIEAVGRSEASPDLIWAEHAAQRER